MPFTGPAARLFSFHYNTNVPKQWMRAGILTFRGVISHRLMALGGIFSSILAMGMGIEGEG
jgi:hypothetical protein